MSTMTLSRDLTTGSINRHLTALSFPLLLGVISAVLINTVDTFFVAQLGVNELAAMGFSFPIAMIGVGFAFGFGAAAASIIGRTLGEGNSEIAKRKATYILISSTLFVIAVSSIGVWQIDNIIELLGVGEQTTQHVKDYILPWFIGLVFLVTPMVGSAIMRGYGSTSVQSIIMISASVTNAILDPILIFGIGSWDGWGIAGASWASVISRGITFAITIYFLFNPKVIVSFKQLTMQEFNKTNAELFRLAIPSSLVNVIAPFSIGIVTRMMSDFGDSAIAAFNIATRIESLLTIPAMALSMGVGAFVSQNIGAGKHDRLYAAWNKIGLFSTIWFMVVIGITVLFREQLIGVFSSEPQSSKYASTMLLALAASSIGTMLVPIFSAFQTASGKARPSLIITIVRYFLLFIPGVYIGAQLFGLNGIIAGIMASQLLSALIAWTWGTLNYKTAVEPSLQPATAMR